FLLFFIESAISDANRLREMQIAHSMLNVLDPLAEAYAFETARYGNPPLEVFANDFRLSGFRLEIGDRTQRNALACGTAGDHGIADWIQRGGRILREPAADGVGAVVDDNGRGCGFSLENCAGVQLDFLGGETGASRDYGIHVHINRRSADGVL